MTRGSLREFTWIDDFKQWSPIKPFGAQASESNEMKVLRRLIQPRADGSFLVPSEIIEKFKDIKGGGREEVLRLYEKCGFNKDG